MRRTCGIKRWRLIAIMGIFLWHKPLNAAPSVSDSPGVTSNAADNSTVDAIGNINDVKLSIPDDYLLSGVQYKKGSFKAPPQNFVPTYNSKIEGFAILVRLSNFQPRKTDQDRVDLINAMHKVIPSFYESWVTVGFSSKTFWQNGEGANRVHFWEEDESHWGPFVRQKKRIAGLVEEDSTQPISASPLDYHEHFDIYYDDTGYNTFIYCTTHKQYVPPYATFTQCHHLFVLPELKVGAEAIYTKKDLPRWREIEKSSTEIIHSFIIQ